MSRTTRRDLVGERVDHSVLAAELARISGEPKMLRGMKLRPERLAAEAKGELGA